MASLLTNTGAAAQLSTVRSERLFFVHARKLQITIGNCPKFGHFKNRMLPGNNLYESEEEKRKLNVLRILQVRLLHSELWVYMGVYPAQVVLDSLRKSTSLRTHLDAIFTSIWHKQSCLWQPLRMVITDLTEGTHSPRWKIP